MFLAIANFKKISYNIIARYYLAINVIKKYCLSPPIAVIQFRNIGLKKAVIPSRKLELKKAVIQFRNIGLKNGEIGFCLVIFK